MTPEITNGVMSKAIEEAFSDRNLLVQMVVVLAKNAGMEAGLIDSQTKIEDWPEFYINLPTGQVTFHVRAENIITPTAWPIKGVKRQNLTVVQHRNRIGCAVMMYLDALNNV